MEPRRTDSGRRIDSAGARWRSRLCLVLAVATTAGFGHPATVRAEERSCGGAPAVQLDYSTRLGGRAADTIADMAVDAAGNVYLAGHTHSVDFPLREPIQASIGGEDGTTAAFVAKLSADGQLVYATYLGGSGDDEAEHIGLDSQGNVYISGSTNSTNFPTTTGVVQPAFDAMMCPGYRCDDVFVTKLDPSGRRLLYSTYLGLTRIGDVEDMAVDADGGVYLTGWADEGLSTTAGALQARNAGGIDAFVVKISPDGRTVGYATYLGTGGHETGRAIGVDGAGRAYVAGNGACTLGTTPGASAMPSGCTFVAMLSANGGALVFASRFGVGGLTKGGAFVDAELEQPTAIAVDDEGHAYVGGFTARASPAGPTQPSVPGASGLLDTDAFLVKLSAEGAFLYSTLLGGPDGGEWVSGIAVGAAGTVHLTGNTQAASFPGAVDLESTLPGAARYVSSEAPDRCWDVFVATLDSTDLTIRSVSRLGGEGADRATALAVDGGGAIWVAGNTLSANFPTTRGALATAAIGEQDGFLVKMVRP